MRWHDCQGRLKATDGREYIGEWKNGKSHGNGTLTYADGTRYVGEFRESLFHGRGVHTLPNGQRYEGEFRGGQYEGQGTLTLADGGRYVGEFRAGVFSGDGTYHFPSDGRYTGQWRDGRPFEGLRYDRAGELVGRVTGGTLVQTRDQATRTQQTRREDARGREIAELDQYIASLAVPRGTPPETVAQWQARWCQIQQSLEKPRPADVGPSGERWPEESRQRYQLAVDELRKEAGTVERQLRERLDRLARPDTWPPMPGGHPFDLVVYVDSLDPGFRRRLDGGIRMGDGTAAVNFQLLDTDIQEFRSLGLQLSAVQVMAKALDPTANEESLRLVVLSLLKSVLADKRVELGRIDVPQSWVRRTTSGAAGAVSAPVLDLRRACSSVGARSTASLSNPTPLSARDRVPQAGFAGTSRSLPALIALPRVALSPDSALGANLDLTRYQAIGAISWADISRSAQTLAQEARAQREASERAARDRQEAAVRAERDFMAAIDRAMQNGGEMVGSIVIRSASTGASVAASRQTACTTALSARSTALQRLVRSDALKALTSGQTPLLVPLASPQAAYDAALDGQCAVIVDLAPQLRQYLQSVGADKRFRYELGPWLQVDR